MFAAFVACFTSIALSSALEPDRQGNAVLLLSAPPGARVWIDEVDYGYQRRFVFKNLAAGQRWYWTLKVEAAPGRFGLYRFTLSPGQMLCLSAVVGDYRVELREQDLLELASSGTVEFQITGEDTDEAVLKIRRLVPYVLSGSVNAGTVLLAPSADYQSLVVIRSASFTLDSSGWIERKLTTVCRDIDKQVPRGMSGYRLAGPDEQLRKLIRAIQRRNATPMVSQAAVWIARWDADYDRLGALVQRRLNFGPDGLTIRRVRLIKEHEAAKAMQICEEAGIDIRRKAIWADRDRILRGLNDRHLREWLRRKAEHRASAGSTPMELRA